MTSVVAVMLVGAPSGAPVGVPRGPTVQPVFSVCCPKLCGGAQWLVAWWRTSRWPLDSVCVYGSGDVCVCVYLQW